VTIRPRKLRRVCWVLAPVVVITFVILGLLLAGPTGEGPGVFRPSDQIAMMVLGVLAGAAILLLTRPKVLADSSRVRVTNVIGGYDLPWEVVRAVRFDPGHPWATLELMDDDVVAVLALQATDSDYAVEGVRALRRLLAARRSPEPSAAAPKADAEPSAGSRPYTA
jgi:Bacterial PH domain